MNTFKRSRPFGFVLIEALIALLLISVGLVGVAKLQALSISGAGDAKARSEAMALSQNVLEQLRNILIRTNYMGTAAYTVTPPWGNSPTLSLASSGTPISVTGTNAVYTLSWTVAANGSPEARLLRLATTWTDRTNTTQRIDLSSLIAWDDPGAQAKLNAAPMTSPSTPTGGAKRNSPNTFSPGTGTANPDGTRLYTDGDNTTYLLKSDGSVLLYLPPKNGTAQAFTTITGKIFFDQHPSGGSNSIPHSNNVQVRLSSEGRCIYDNSVSTVTSNGTVTSGSNLYSYFIYTCYVGAGWYGNVGIAVDASIGSQAGDPTVCVGDPAFNSGVSDGTLIAASPIEAVTRSYRGFKASGGSYLSTGVAGGSKYGLSYGLVGTVVTPLAGPFNGKPVPSAYPAYYPTVAQGSSNDYFEQNFLITNINGGGNNNNSDSCATKMAGGAFTRNAGAYVCITPDDDAATDACPPIWPNFEGQVGSGGAINYTLTVAKTGSGTVTSSPSGISCGTSCSASYASGTSITLTAVPASGSVVSWTGCTSSSGNTCTVSLTGSVLVTATFATASSYTVSVSSTGTGGGTITSSDSQISCPNSCSASYVSGSTVTLTATPDSASTFTSWSGCTSVASNVCTVTVSGAATATATFTAIPSYVLTLTKAGTGTGTVTSSPSGINCNAACGAGSASYLSGTSVTLTAAPDPGSALTSWAGCTSSSGNTCTVTVSAASNVTATFNTLAAGLTVSKAGSGSGTVTGSPAGIACGSTCFYAYTSGTSVALTPAAAAGSTFTGWSGCTSVAGNVCNITVSGASSVTATFTAQPTYGVTVTPAGTGTGTVTSSPAGISCGSTCSASFSSGSTVVLTATPAGVSTFAGWSGGGCSGTGTCSITVGSSAVAVTATFTVPSYTLTVTNSSSTGLGSVTSSSGGINCGSTCSASYASGTSVTLTAAATPGSVFTGWTGGVCSGNATTCTVTMSAARSVTATFTYNAVCTTPISGTAHAGNGSVSISGNTAGSCAMGSGNTLNYSCTGVTAPSGTLLTLTNDGPGNNAFTYTLNVTADCLSHSNVNFP